MHQYIACDNIGLSLTGAATVTVEREEPIGHARHENCDIHTLSMTWPDLPVDGRAQLYSLQKYAKICHTSAH